MKGGNKTRDRILISLALLVPVLWAAILAAPFLSQGLFGILEGLSQSIARPFDIQLVADTPRAIFIFVLIYGLCLAVFFSSVRNTRRNEEYGSATWGNPKTLNKKYANTKSPRENLILTQNVRIGFDGYVHQRNLNTMVIGGSGSSKSRSHCIPALLNASAELNSCSYICLDPKGELLRKTGTFLKSQGYKIRVLDLINHNCSDGYNPFKYLRDDADVMRLVTNLIKNTTPKGSSTSDPFWERSETALLEACICYLKDFAIEDEQNFATLMEMLSSAEIREEDEDYSSPLDILFERKEMEKPDCLAVKLYRIYRQAAGKTAKSILISTLVRIEKFALSSLAFMTSYDALELEKIGEEKTALFAIIPDNDSSFNFIIGMLYTQIFQQLFFLADYKYGGRLPIPVHFIADEFCNVALPDDYEKIISVTRSRNVFVSHIIQNISSLKAIFDKQWEGILGNCDLILYMGGNEQSSHKLISELIGKETVATETYGKTLGTHGSYSTNYQQAGRDLVDPSEIRMLDNRKCVLMIRGEKPVIDDKFNLLSHPNYKHLEDGGAEPYRHGEILHHRDFGKVSMRPGGKYRIVSREELERKYLSKTRKG